MACELPCAMAHMMMRIVPQVLGEKDCRKYGLGALLREARAALPDNGAGPVFEERRNFAQALHFNCMSCGRCGDKML